MKQPQAFTLLELLVAVTIALLLAGLLLTVTTGTLDLMRRTQGNLSAGAEAGLVLDFLTRDLQAALQRGDGGTWLAVDVISNPAELTGHGWLTTAVRLKPAGNESLRLLPDPDIGAARYGLAGAWLRLVTTNIESNGSLPVAVAYQIARRPVTGSIAATNPAAVRYTLFRSAVSTTETFANGYDVTAPAYASVGAAPTASRSPATLTNPSNTDALAGNVVDFGLRFYVRNGDGSLRRIFPADDGDTVHAAVGGAETADANRFPEVVDVMVRILTEEGATRVENMEAGRVARPPIYSTDAAWWWGEVEAHSQVYVRRIVIDGVAP